MLWLTSQVLEAQLLTGLLPLNLFLYLSIIYIYDFFLQSALNLWTFTYHLSISHGSFFPHLISLICSLRLLFLAGLYSAFFSPWIPVLQHIDIFSY